jgi:hypothetical protein
MKGIFEFEVGEPKEKRGFKFGTYAFKVACEKDGSILSDLLKKIGIPYQKGVDSEGKPLMVRDGVNLTSLLNVFYGAAVHFTESKKQEANFELVDVSDWIDELGYDRVNEMLGEGLTQYAPKNSKSLAETGENSQ